MGFYFDQKEIVRKYSLLSKYGSQVYFSPLTVSLSCSEHCCARNDGTSFGHGSVLQVLYRARSPMQNNPPFAGEG